MEYSPELAPALIHLTGIAYWRGITGEKMQTTKWLPAHMQLYFGSHRALGWRGGKRLVRFYETAYKVAKRRREEIAQKMSPEAADVVTSLMAEGFMAAFARPQWEQSLRSKDAAERGSPSAEVRSDR